MVNETIQIIDQQYYPHLSPLILLMGKNSNKCYKNAICASVGLLIVFTTSIFVAKDYFGLRIATLIEQAALLKDYKYADWGQHPGNIDAEYTYTVSLYDQKTEGDAAKIDPATFRHSFNYKNISFGQGNQGFIKFLHEWDLTPQGEFSSTPVSTINLAAQKIYTYERLAPPARRFATLYNTLWRTVEQQLLPFFAAQLHTFYFKNRKTVESVVFSEINLPADTIEAIYIDQTFGWGKVETFQPWVMLAHQKNRNNMIQYELIQETLGISRDQLQRLVGEHSMLNTLSTALNGTIKLILQNPRTYTYRKCDPFCTNDQLVAFQLLTGALTSSPVFMNVNMKSSLRDLNSTLPNDVELNKVCPSCILDQNAINFFTGKYLGNFSILAKAFVNLSDTDAIQDLFNLQDPTFAQNIVDYMNYLQDNIFNPTNPNTQEVDNEAYQFMLNNHLYVNGAINALKDILNIELHTRAMAKVIEDKQLKCEDFFNGQYKTFVGLCQKQAFDLTKINAIRTYIKAYFFQGRTEFIKSTGMNEIQASQFLRIDQNSKFAANIEQIRTTLSTAFGCSNTFCTEEQLLVMEWSGQNDILSRLPANFFADSSVSITEWDVQNKLSGVQPQFHKLAGQKLSTEQGKLLLGSGKQSILVLFNLLSMKTQCDAGDENAKKLVNYVQKVSFDVYFGGANTVRPFSEVLLGFQPSGLTQKRLAGDLVGGASWLPEKVQLIKTKHRPSAYSKINTGIYNRDRLRNMLEVEQSTVFGSHLTLFQSEYEEVTQFLTSGQAVFGTNMLGFPSDLSSSDTLAVLLNFAYQSTVLSANPTETKLNGVDALRYSFKPIPKSFIGLNEQNERSLSISPDSYIIVDPITGNTLQFNVKFTVSSPASFLKYYPNASTSEKPIFDCEVYYSRKDVSAIAEIADAKSTLRAVYILTIVLASLSMISIVVFAIILRVKNRGSARELNDTLISSEGSSLVSSEGKSSIKS